MEAKMGLLGIASLIVSAALGIVTARSVSKGGAAAGWIVGLACFYLVQSLLGPVAEREKRKDCSEEYGRGWHFDSCMEDSTSSFYDYE